MPSVAYGTTGLSKNEKTRKRQIKQRKAKDAERHKTKARVGPVTSVAGALRSVSSRKRTNKRALYNK